MGEGAHQQGVLENVRRALGRTATLAPVPLNDFAPVRAESNPQLILERFIHEVQLVRGSVHICAVRDLVSTILEIQPPSAGEIAISGAHFLSEQEVEANLAAKGCRIFNAAGILHHDLVARSADAAAGITAVDYGLAETGTLAVSSDEPGALLVSLLPPVHIAVVRQAQIYNSLDEVVGGLSEQLSLSQAGGRSVSFITGPSRTSDVELVLSIGVHGPKELHVVILVD